MTSHRNWWLDEHTWIRRKPLPMCIGDLEALLLGQAVEFSPKATSANVVGHPISSNLSAVSMAQQVPPQRYCPLGINQLPSLGVNMATQDATQPLEELRAVIVLSETSQELLLSIVPPLHPIQATTRPGGGQQPLSIALGGPSVPVQQLLADLPPVGHELVVEVVGFAADDRLQAVAIQGPAWISPHLAAACPHPHLLVSWTPDAHPAEAGDLLALGLAGALGDCYQPLDEGLPLVGMLGVVAQDGRVLTTQEAMQQLQRSTTALGGGSIDSGGNSAAAAAAAGVGAAGPMAGAAAHAQPGRLAAALPAQAGRGEAGAEDGAGAGMARMGAEAPGGAGSMPQDDDFEMWMQLDERASPGTHMLPPKKPAPPPSTSAQGVVVSACCDEPGPPVAGERVCWLDDVSVGDLVEVVPLSAPHHPPKAGAAREQEEEEPEVVEERVQGIVDEVMTDDMFQTQGVLVRLQEDNTMGNVARVLSSRHRQRQQEWPSLLQGTGVVAPVDSVPAPAKAPSQAAEEEQDEAPGQQHSPKMGVAKSKKQQQQTMRNGTTCAPASRPVGGVQVLYKSSKKGKPPPGGRLGNFVARQMQMGGMQVASEGADASEAAASVRALETWQVLQESYGEFVTAAVLKDCKGDVEQAVAVLLDQDSLLDRLAVIVERSVQQVEEEASAAAAAVAVQETARTERASAAGRRRGGWGGSRPGTYGSAAGARTPAPEASSFPPLASQHCNRTSRPCMLQPRSVPPGRHKPGGGGDMTESWGASETLTGRIKVLQNSDSLTSLAQQHGLSVRDAEALKQLFPTLDNPFVVSTLADVKGDVTAAFDYLLDAGILPGPAPQMDDLFDLGGDAGSSSTEGSYLAVATSLQGSGLGTNKQADESIFGGPCDGLPFEEKVGRLLSVFEGLDSSLAEYTLRQCNEDLAAAAAFLHDCLHADNSAAAAAIAQSEAVAAAIARPSSYAGVTEVVASHAGARDTAPTAHAAAPRSSRTAVLPGQQQQQAAEGGYEQGKAGTGDGAVQEEEGWQQARPNAWKAGGGASAKDAADKERSRLRSSKAREIAHIYFNFRNVFFQQANAAYNAGDGKAAAEFSKRGRHYGELAKQFRQASNEEAYKASNLGIRNTFVMDLHGMHVSEALALLERQMDALGRLVSPEGVLLKCITGWGAHSARGIALIKPAVLDWAKQKGCKHFVEPGNDGVVIVHVTPNDRYNA